MREFLMEHKPYNILETGTNYGSFSYTCYETLSDFRLYTCDNHPDNNSMRCINFINEYYDDNKVRYFHKESRHFLNDLRNDGTKFDLAWLDSTHTYEFLLEEMNIVADMKVPFIMIDDFWTQKELQNAVLDFVRRNPEYRIHSFSNIRENVGSIIILQRIEADNLNLDK